MTYGSQIWGQSNHIIINKIQCLQNRALKKISFWKGNTNTLYKNLNMLKFIDITHLQNCIFMHSFVRDELPTSFKQHFTYINDKHGHGTRGANLQLLDMPRTSTRAYGDTFYQNTMHTRLEQPKAFISTN